MNKDLLIKLLESVADGKTTVEGAAGRLEHMAYEDIAYAHIDHHRSLRKGFPEVIFGEGKTADQIAGIMEKMQNQENIILVTRIIISAGTSDIPVAREAYLTARAMGNTADTIFDVGVSGIHRLLDHHKAIDQANVLIVVAGMEGALPSVVAGMVDRPVIAVPTSIGYGVNLGGLTALFAMLNSCSSNVAVVNIDNGFGAGYMASTINRD